jgi:hypothetical protein
MPKPAADGPLLDAPPAFVEARVREVADGIRRKAEESLQQAEASARNMVAAQIAQERSLRTDLERGEPFAFLRTLKSTGVEPHELLSTSAGLERFFKPRGSGGTVDGPRLTRQTALQDGDRIVFPAGQHPLDVGAWGHAAFANDLTIEGQSMDATLVVLSQDLSARNDVHNLTLRDLTLDCGDNYLTDFRGVGITLRVERCRLIGFDMGAGGSVMLAADAGVFHATNSRIEAGFGRSPGSGNLFRVRSGFLARLEGCTVVGPFRSVMDDGTYLFERCTFEAVRKQDLERNGDRVRLVDCTFRDPAEQGKETKQRRVSEINPAWTGTRR